MGKPRIKPPPSVTIRDNGTVSVRFPECIPTAEAAMYLRSRGFATTAGTLEVWRSQARGPRYRKIGRRVYYTQEFLDDFLRGVEMRVIDPAAIEKP